MKEELVLKIIDEKLKHEHIAPEWLCNGLCTISEYNGYGTGEKNIDYLTLETMLERLGMNSIDFISWVDYDVYEYLERKNSILEAMENKDTVTLSRLLYSNDINSILNSKLAMQFNIMAVSVLEWFEGRTAKAQEYAKIAAKYIAEESNQEPDNEDIMPRMMSDKEIAMYVLSYYFELENNLENNAALEIVSRCLGQLLRYIDGDGRDIRSVALLFPYISYQYVRIQIILDRPEQGIAPCKRSIKLMRQHNQCRMLEMTLKQYVQLMENLGIGDRAKEEEKLLKSWQEVLGLLRKLSEHVLDEESDFVVKLLKCGVWYGGAFESESDIIKMYRAREGITQKRLSIDVDYSMRSMWMIENSKAKPQKNGYEKIRKRLGIPSGRIHSDIYCTSYKAYMLKYQLERVMMNYEFEKVEEIIHRLENELIRTRVSDGVNSLANEQFIMDCCNVASYMQSKITAREYLERCKKCLAITVDIEKKKIDKVFLRVEELLIIIHISQAYNVLGNNEKAVYYLKVVIDYCRSRNIKSKAYINKMLMAYMNLSIYLGDMGQYDKALECSKKGLELDIQLGKGKLAISFIYNYAYLQTMLKNYPEALNGFEIVIHSSEIFGNSNYDKAVSNYAWVKNKIESENT